MRLSISKSKNATSLYVIKSTYENGVHSSKIVEKLGTIVELEKKLNGQDPIEWANKYIEELNRKDKEESLEIIVKHSPTKIIAKDEQRSFNGGYLFLQQIYYGLGLDKICKDITKRYKFTFDLDSVLSRLLYARIIYPSSKLATFQLSQRFIEQSAFELQHIYRALEVITKESDSIQASLYTNSIKYSKRNTGVLYYDCTNYFFEIEQEDGLKQYGISKEHRPNPIVQMGLFMDGDGIPLAFNINKGNTNEQGTMKPLEEQILSDFNLSKFIVCTDASLASEDNRRFNDRGDRAFITTQSIKKLKKHLREWALTPEGWTSSVDGKTYDISKLDEGKDNDTVFFKERWIKENDFEQKFIVTYSIKYRDYQRFIRNSQIERAQKLVKSNSVKLKKCNSNDYKRFIKKTHCTDEGEVAKHALYGIDTNLVAQEETFDGFYGVCTNLEDDASAIIRVNRRRWEIEECFRIMKSEFKARPVYLSREDRIKAHFTTCFLALVIFRFLEKKLQDKYTCHDIIDGLRDMNFLEIKGSGYVPAYTRTDFTDDLHEAVGFRTDYQIVSSKQMKKIFKLTKS
jgi:transposase